MTFSDDALIEQQYDAWQNQLLAEMGITRWVSQTCPVKTFDDLDNLELLFNPQTLDDALNTPLVLASVQADLTSQTTHQPPSSEQATTSHQAVHTNAAVASAPALLIDTPALDTAKAPQQDDDKVINTGAAVSFDLQAIVVGEWILVVDSHHLQQDERQQQLWQQISRGLRAPLHFFRFPLLDDNHQLPTATAQLMRSYALAAAGFSGFLFSLNQYHPKVGALTQLPDCLEEQPIQRLPYIDEMLDDYRLKRQLWQLLSS